MIIQACLNGSRDAGYHPRVPVAADALARDGARCLAAGAAELHVHPRDDDGRESLSGFAVGRTLAALRRACPGTLLGVSTAACIEGDVGRTLEAIDGWTELPDYASVNLGEEGAIDVMGRLRRKGIGIEAGLASGADAERLVRAGGTVTVFRLLVESMEQDFEAARRTIEEIVAVVRTRLWQQRPILMHGFDATVWPTLRLAREKLWSSRIGFEDGKLLPDGTLASCNAELVSCAVRYVRHGQL